MKNVNKVIWILILIELNVHNNLVGHDLSVIWQFVGINCAPLRSIFIIIQI